MTNTIRSRWLLMTSGAITAVLVLAACGSSGSKSSSSTAATPPPTTAAAAASTGAPSTSFSAADLPGVGMVMTDARGETVYVLTADGKTNLPCEDSTGCTKIWPDLALPTGTTAATAGTGVDGSKLSTMKQADGQTYPTYNGWLMYEFVKDTGPGQVHGQGVKTFGGTWYTLSPSGTPVTTAAGSTPTTKASGGYGY